MTTNTEVRAHRDYVASREDECRDEKSVKSKKEAKADPGFAKAMEGFIKRPDYKKMERVSKMREQIGRTR